MNIPVRYFAVAAGLVLTGLFFTALAQPDESLDLGTVLELAADADNSVHEARKALGDAERDLLLLEADPQALPLDRADAERSVAAAADRVRLAELEAELEAAKAYTDLLEARASLSQAEQQLEITELSLNGTRTRYEAGAAAELAVIEAENAVTEAESSYREAVADLGFAADDLAVRTGLAVSGSTVLEPLTEEALPGSPDEAAASERLIELSGSLRDAERAVSAAADNYAATDNELSSRNEIEAARTGLADAEAAWERALTTAKTALGQSLSSLTANENRYRNALAALDVAAANLEAQRARYEAGSISRLALLEQEAGYAGTEATAASALHSLFIAQLQLEVTILQ